MTPLDRMLPTLVHIQTHLDDDLRLERLARVAGLSPGHFSRTFSATIGESPHAYVERLRLERAAFLLVVREATVLEVALDTGFRSHETFTRAFTRRFATPPSRWRLAGGAAAGAGEAARDGHRPELGDGLAEGSLSSTHIRARRPLPVLFERHVGAYDQVPPDLWRRVRSTAARRGLAASDILLGVAHDAPGVTAPDQCRFDACIAVDRATADGWVATGGVGVQLLPGGPFATTTYVGPYAGLAAAYGAIVARISARAPRVELVGLPAIETYRTTEINPEASLNETEIALPVRIAGAGGHLEDAS